MEKQRDESTVKLGNIPKNVFLAKYTFHVYLSCRCLSCFLQFSSLVLCLFLSCKGL